MNDECTDLKKEVDRAGDKHYSAMTEWLTGGRTPEQRKRAYGFAIAYRRGLTWLVDCYSRIRSRFGSRRKMQAAEEFKDLVERDIAVLDKYSES